MIYDRIPHNHICLFDIEDCSMNKFQNFLCQSDLEYQAFNLGFDFVPCYFTGETLFNENYFIELLDNISILGGTKIEGIVIKNYNKFSRDKKIMMGKFVSQYFKEINNEEFKKKNPSPVDIKQKIINMYRTTARWNKSIQHLRESGLITNKSKDIGPLIKEIHEDIRKECEDEIKNEFYFYFLDDILRGTTSGFPEWYKDKLQKEEETKKNI